MKNKTGTGCEVLGTSVAQGYAGFEPLMTVTRYQVIVTQYTLANKNLGALGNHMSA
jgi:hypothetical protein